MWASRSCEPSSTQAYGETSGVTAGGQRAGNGNRAVAVGVGFDNRIELGPR